MRTEALNHALRGIPEDRVIVHMCWGSGKGPHTNDLPLEAIRRHRAEHQRRRVLDRGGQPAPRLGVADLAATSKLPDGKVLIPGVIAHCTDHVEHPRLVAQRLVRYAEVVGRENVIAGTDCGIGSRVADRRDRVGQAASAVAGARIASEQLWGVAQHVLP